MPDTHQGQGSRLPRRPRKDVWAQHMPIIRRLYLDEARPLREVMDTMENEHGFRARSVAPAHGSDEPGLRLIRR